MELYLTVPGEEFFDQEKNVFVQTADTPLVLRHTLVSISKWEAKYERTFLSEGTKTREEILDYVRMMSLTVIDDDVFLRLTEKENAQISEYIQKKHSASRLQQQHIQPGGANREKTTSDLIYYWMIALGIPWEAQYWHLERLLTLIEIVQRKTEAANKQSSRKGSNKSDMARQRRSAAAHNRARYGSTG